MKPSEAIENLEYLISGDCCDTQMDYVEEIELAIAALREKRERENALKGDINGTTDI